MFIQVNSQVLYYEHTGDGYPIILLHGNGGDHKMFEPLIRALSDKYDVYAIDTRGHGQSAKPKEYHYSDMADDLIGFVRALELNKPAVLGFSDGAIVAMIAGSRESELFSHLILCGGNMTPKGLDRHTQKIIKKNYKNTNDPLQKLMLEEPNITISDLGHITAHTLVVSGSKDCIRKSETETIASAISHSTSHIIKDADHLSYIVNNDMLAPVIKEFIG